MTNDKKVLSDEQIEQAALASGLDEELWFGRFTPAGYEDTLPKLRRFAQAVLAASPSPEKAPNAHKNCGYTWPAKACPCGGYQRDGCEEHGCQWERDPSLVPESLRKPVGPSPEEAEAARPEPPSWVCPRCKADRFKGPCGDPYHPPCALTATASFVSSQPEAAGTAGGDTQPGGSDA